MELPVFLSNGSVNEELEDLTKSQLEKRRKNLEELDITLYPVGTPVPLVDQMIHITRAEIVVGDYFCFLRLPLRVRERFREIANSYYEHLKNNTLKK